MTDLCATCGKDAETCDSFGNDYTMEHGNFARCTKYIMSEETAKKIIINDPQGNIIKRMEAVAIARSILGEDCSMEDIWRWAEGNVKEVTVRVKTCFECTAYVDIDGEQPRCGLDCDPLKCDRKMAITDKFTCTSL